MPPSMPAFDDTFPFGHRGEAYGQNLQSRAPWWHIGRGKNKAPMLLHYCIAYRLVRLPCCCGAFAFTVLFT